MNAYEGTKATTGLRLSLSEQRDDLNVNVYSTWHGII